MKRLLLMLLGFICSTIAWSADGDTFTSKTVEGVDITFKVISEEKKTCEVGTGYVNSPAVSSTYTGQITIPSKVNEYNVTAIRNSAFSECKMTSVVIPESVLKIGDKAFWNCYSLTSLSLSEGVEVIGDRAFAGCMKLVSLHIPNTINSIEEFAFANCRDLSSIVVSDDNTVFDSHNNCNAIIKTSSKELIVGCKNTVIPRDVRSIGNNAFYGCYNLDKIVIPDNVYRIGESAFNSCANLKSINIPDKITSIGNYAFYCCYSLTSITLPPNVSFGYYTFRDTGLTKIVVGATQPKSLNGNEFNKTDQMTLYVPQGSKSKYESTSYWRDFKEIVELTNGTCIPYGDMNIRIIDGTEKKCEIYSAVSQPSYTIVPSSVSGYKVIGIDEEAFKNEDDIESIAIPSSIEYIGKDAFEKCEINKVIISDLEKWCKISFDGTLSNPLNGAYLYLVNGWSDNENLVEDLYIPNNVSAINEYAFYGCLGLNSVFFPKEVSLIGNYAFYNCQQLDNVTIDNSTPLMIINNSFLKKRATLYVPYGSIQDYVDAGFLKYFKEIKSIPLSDGDTFVEKTAEGVEMIFRVISNDDKTCSVGKGYVGYNDDPPEPYCIRPDYEGNVTIPTSANGYKVISIANQAFSSTNGMKVKSINIPDCITIIGRKAFENCKALSTIDLPNSITSISDYAFASCDKLESAILPDKIVTVPIGMFQGCSNLKSIIIPSSVQQIGWNAFRDCNSLSSFTIPESVWIIGIDAFSGTAWLNNHPDGLVYKDNILLGYKGDKPKGSLEIAKGTRLIGTYAFEDCKEISSVIFPQTVKHIMYDAFYGCNSIKLLELPYFLNSIFGEAFMGCSGLTNITFPKTISRIDPYAFSGCDNISKVFMECPTPIDLSSIVFSNKSATLYVPDGSKSLYEIAEGWKDFKEIVEQKVEVTEIDEIYCHELKINKGASVKASIKISDENLINAFEFNLVLPKGITIEKDNDGNLLISKGDLLKVSGWRVVVTELEDNTFHFKCYTTVKGDIIYSKWGELLILSLKTTEDMQKGVFYASINNILLKLLDEKLLKAKDCSFVVEMTNFVKGDANGDGEVDVKDIVAITEYMMGKEPENFNIMNADVNGDGVINIADIIQITNQILSKE